MRMCKKLTAILAVALMAGTMVGCGDDDDANGGSPNNGDKNGQEWEELEERRGWLEQRTGEEPGEGAYIEGSFAQLPETCDGTLESKEDGPGLGWVRKGTFDNAGSNDLNDGTGPTYFSAQFDTRPDLDVESTPIFRASLNDPRYRAFEESDEYDRLIEVSQGGGMSPVLYRACDTVYERGTCHVPTDAFSGDGCSMAPESSLSSQYGVETLEMDGGDGLFEFQVGSLCEDSNIIEGVDTDPWEDPELRDSLGVQEITLVGMDAWELGEARELSEEDVEWASSYNSSRNCQDLRNPGPMCDCVWDFRDVEEFERAWALPMEDRVYVELKGSGEDSDFYFWGIVER